MLVLGRKVGESVMIGDDIKITVTDVRNNAVRIGVEAPIDVSVHRQEVYDKIQEGKP